MGAGVNVPVDTSRNPTWYVLVPYGPKPHTGSWHPFSGTWGRLRPGTVANGFTQTRPATTAIARRAAMAGANHRTARDFRRFSGSDWMTRARNAGSTGATSRAVLTRLTSSSSLIPSPR